MVERSIRKYKKTIIKIGSDGMRKRGILQCIFIVSLVILLINTLKINVVKNNLSFSNSNVELAIYLDDEQTNRIPSKDSGYYLDLEKSTCTNNANIYFDTNTWSPVIKNMSEYKIRCELHFGSTYKETILNGTDPVLEEPLIPVTIDNDGTVRKTSLANEWYSYENKKWANAVILFDENETYEDGEIISEEKIESYFVWIPKYRYQLWDLGLYDTATQIDESKVHEISIIFGDYTTLDEREGECTTPMKSGSTGNCQIGDYMTHPAFLSISSTGFWVGKFETGYKGATNITEAEQNINDSSRIIVKPNVYSWRNIQVANAFYSSYNYQRNLDSHMMKNTEWGAVTYLQHSVYGSATSVRINNNSDYITGYQANDESICDEGDTSEDCNRYCNDNSCNLAYPNSVLASTTNNISGIFDMSGSWNYVMGVMVDQNGSPYSGRNSLYNSGFNGPFGCPDCDNDTSGLTELTNGYDWPEEKYYDLYYYADTNSSKYSNRILGDATGELGPFESIDNSLQRNSWYKGIGYSLTRSYPIFNRGSSNQFAFSYAHSGNQTNRVFRMILTPTNTI